MNRLSKSNKPLNSEISGLNNNSENSYSATTNGVEITVWPEFIDNQISKSQDLFIWTYQIRIDNNSDETLQLINRYWKIIDEQGLIQEVSGAGVIGEQPKIAPNGSHKYSSGVHLSNPSGIMSGYYEMQKENGEKFKVQIPAFSLDSPYNKSSIN